MWITPEQLYNTTEQIKTYADSKEGGGSVDPAIVEKVNKNTADIKVLQNTSKTQTDNIAKNATAIADNASAIANTEKTANDASTAVNALKTTVEGNATAIEDVTTTATQNTQEINNLKTANETLTTDIGGINTSLGTLQEDSSKLKTDVNQLQATVADMDSTVKEASKTATDAQEAVTDMQTNVATNTTEIEKLKTITEAHNTAIESNTTNINNNTGALGTLDTKVGGLETQVADLAEEVKKAIAGELQTVEVVLFEGEANDLNESYTIQDISQYKFLNIEYYYYKDKNNSITGINSTFIPYSTELLNDPNYTVVIDSFSFVNENDSLSSVTLGMRFTSNTEFAITNSINNVPSAWNNPAVTKITGLKFVEATDYDNLKTEVETLQTDVMDIQGSVAAVEADVTKAQSDATMAIDKATELNTSLGETNTTVAGISEDVDTLNTDVATLKTRTDNLETLVNELAARGVLEQKRLWTGTLTEINSSQSIAGNLSDYDYLYIEGQWNTTGEAEYTDKEALISQFVKLDSNITMPVIPISWSTLSESPLVSWGNKEVSIALNLTENTFSLLTNNGNDTDKNTITKLVGWKLDGNINTLGAKETVLFEGNADTVGTTYDFVEDISSFDYLYVKGSITTGLNPINTTVIYKVSDLLDSENSYTGFMGLQWSGYLDSQSYSKHTNIQLINSTSFKVTSIQNNAGDSLDIIPTKIIGWKFSPSNNGSAASSAVNYSYEEQKIGTWVDGKPLYQKVVEFTIPTNQVETTHDISDIPFDTIRIAECDFIVSNNNPAQAPWIVQQANNLVGSRTYIHKNQKQIIWSWSVAVTITGTVRAIIQYTKTTD